MRITTLGDLLLDVVVRLDVPLETGADRVAETTTAVGGQAANVAAWSSALGADARFVGKRGDDLTGEIVTRELIRRGVEVCGPTGGHNGIVVSIASDGERTMASDRGIAPSLEPADLDPAWFDCDVLHLSGYSLLREPIALAALQAATYARAAGATVSVDVSAWTLVDDSFRDRIRALEPDVIFANEREREVFGPLDAMWVVKRGAEGVVVDGEAHEARPTDLIDATGAGDALAAGYLVGGVQLGLEAAARCCSTVGAMPFGAMP